MKNTCSYFGMGIVLALLLIISESKNVSIKLGPQSRKEKLVKNKSTTVPRLRGAAKKQIPNRQTSSTEPLDVIANLPNLESGLVDPEKLVKGEPFTSNIKNTHIQILEKFGYNVLAVIVHKLPQAYEAKSEHYLSEIRDTIVKKFSVPEEKIVLLLTVLNSKKEFISVGDVEAINKVLSSEKLSQFLEDVNKNWVKMEKDEDPGKIISAMLEEFNLLLKHSKMLSSQIMIAIIICGVTLILAIVICILCCKKKAEEKDSDKKAEAEPLNPPDEKGTTQTETKADAK